MSAEQFPFLDQKFGRVPRSCAHRREHGPLGTVTLPSGDGGRLAVWYDDVEAVLTDPRVPSMVTHAIRGTAGDLVGRR